MSDPSDQAQLESTIGDCKRLLNQAYKRYNDAILSGAAGIATYWDGYIRGVQHVIGMQEE